MTTLVLTGIAYLVTLTLLAIELHQTAPADRRAWLRQHAPPLLWTLPVTFTVALFAQTDTTPLHTPWAVVIAPAAATAAYLLAIGRRS